MDCLPLVECLPVTVVNGVGYAKEQQLLKAGIRTLEQLVYASDEVIDSLKGKWVSNVLENANDLFLDLKRRPYQERRKEFLRYVTEEGAAQIVQQAESLVGSVGLNQIKALLISSWDDSNTSDTNTASNISENTNSTNSLGSTPTSDQKCSTPSALTNGWVIQPVAEDHGGNSSTLVKDMSTTSIPAMPKGMSVVDLTQDMGPPPPRMPTSAAPSSAVDLTQQELVDRLMELQQKQAQQPRVNGVAPAVASASLAKAMQDEQLALARLHKQQQQQLQQQHLLQQQALKARFNALRSNVMAVNGLFPVPTAMPMVSPASSAAAALANAGVSHAQFQAASPMDQLVLIKRAHEHHYAQQQAPLLDSPNSAGSVGGGNHSGSSASSAGSAGGPQRRRKGHTRSRSHSTTSSLMTSDAVKGYKPVHHRADSRSLPYPSTASPHGRHAHHHAHHHAHRRHKHHHLRHASVTTITTPMGPPLPMQNREQARRELHSAILHHFQPEEHKSTLLETPAPAHHVDAMTHHVERQVRLHKHRSAAHGRGSAHDSSNPVSAPTTPVEWRDPFPMALYGHRHAAGIPLTPPPRLAREQQSRTHVRHASDMYTMYMGRNAEAKAAADEADGALDDMPAKEIVLSAPPRKNKKQHHLIQAQATPNTHGVYPEQVQYLDTDTNYTDYSNQQGGLTHTTNSLCGPVPDTTEAVQLTLCTDNPSQSSNQIGFLGDDTVYDDTTPPATATSAGSPSSAQLMGFSTNMTDEAAPSSPFG